jgi:hypothetical protein
MPKKQIKNSGRKEVDDVVNLDAKGVPVGVVGPNYHKLAQVCTLKKIAEKRVRTRLGVQGAASIATLDAIIEVAVMQARQTGRVEVSPEGLKEMIQMKTNAEYVIEDLDKQVHDLTEIVKNPNPDKDEKNKLIDGVMSSVRRGQGRREILIDNMELYMKAVDNADI